MKDLVSPQQSNKQPLTDSFLKNISLKGSPLDDDTIPSFEPDLKVASDEQVDQKFEQIDQLKYKMTDSDDAYVTERRSTPKELESDKPAEKKVDEPVQQKTTLQIGDPTTNPLVPVTKFFVSPESVNRHLNVFSQNTQGIITESIQIIHARLADGRSSHTFNFQQSGLQVQFESEGDQLVVRVKGDLPLSQASEELIKYQYQLWGYMQDMFPDRDVTVRLEPDQMPDDTGGQSGQEQSSHSNHSDSNQEEEND